MAGWKSWPGRLFLLEALCPKTFDVDWFLCAFVCVLSQCAKVYNNTKSLPRNENRIVLLPGSIWSTFQNRELIIFPCLHFRRLWTQIKFIVSSLLFGQNLNNQRQTLTEHVHHRSIVVYVIKKLSILNKPVMQSYDGIFELFEGTKQGIVYCSASSLPL